MPAPPRQASRAAPPHSQPSVGFGAGQSLDRIGIGAGKHPLGHLAAKAGAGEDAELAFRIGGGAAIRPEPAAAGKGAGGGEIGVGNFAAQGQHGFGCDRILDPLGREPGADFGRGFAAPMQGLHAGRGIGGVVEQARIAVALDQRVDQPLSLLLRFGRGRRTAPRPPPQHPPQIFGRAGKAAEIGQCPAFEKLGRDFALVH